MQINYLSQLKDFFVCIFKPQKLLENHYTNLKFSSKFWQYTKLFITAEFITIFVAIAQMIFTAIFSSLLNYNLDKNTSFSQLLNFQNSSQSGNLLGIIIMLIFIGAFICIIAPVIEEIIFRLHLKLKNIYIALSFGIFIGYFGISELTSSLLEKYSSFDKLLQVALIFLVTIVATIILVILFQLILKYTKFGNLISKIYTKKFAIPFYLSIITFGFIHILNFQNLPKFGFLAIPFLTLNQLWIGYVLVYIRMRFGIGYSILTHIIHNSLTIIVVIILFLIAALLNPALFQ